MKSRALMVWTFSKLSMLLISIALLSLMMVISKVVVSDFVRQNAQFTGKDISSMIDFIAFLPGDKVYREIPLPKYLYESPVGNVGYKVYIREEGAGGTPGSKVNEIRITPLSSSYIVEPQNTRFYSAFDHISMCHITQEPMKGGREEGVEYKRSDITVPTMVDMGDGHYFELGTPNSAAPRLMLSLVVDAKTGVKDLCLEII